MPSPLPLREQLASLAHDQWASWMEYLFSKSVHNPDGSVTIPPELVKRWKRQTNTPYAKLTQTEQDSDRKEADKFISVVMATKP